MTRVLGVDGCKKGWIGISNDLRGYFGKTIDELAGAADTDGLVDVIAVDIPIGLPEVGPRAADALARHLVGPRHPSVFSTPIRAALEAPTHKEGSAAARAATGKGITIQAYGLGPKILEVDAWVRHADRTVIEVHPEVCFAVMAARSLVHAKTTWAGIEERRTLLKSAGFLPVNIGEVGARAAVDDVLDAAAAAWTASRYVSGSAVSHPSPPEVFHDGPTGAIWA